MDDCHQIFLLNGNTVLLSLYTESMNIFFKKIFSPFIKSVFDLFITLERSETRQNKFESNWEIIESVVSSPFVKAEADSDRIFCNVFETVCASCLAMCAYRICERLHLTFSGHLNLYSQQANTNFRFPSEQIPLVSG